MTQDTDDDAMIMVGFVMPDGAIRFERMTVAELHAKTEGR